MKNLENGLPQGSVSVPSSDMGHAERELVGSYMRVEAESANDCYTCNNCGSGDCSSCCGSTDD